MSDDADRDLELVKARSDVMFAKEREASLRNRIERLERLIAVYEAMFAALGEELKQ